MDLQALCDPLACLCNLHFNKGSRVENQMTKPHMLKLNTALESESTQAAEVVFCWLLAGSVSPPSPRLQHCMGAWQHSRVTLQHPLNNHQQLPCTQNALQPPKLCCRLGFVTRFPVGSSPARLKSPLQRAAWLKCSDGCQKMAFSDTNAMMCTGGVHVQSQARI